MILQQNAPMQMGGGMASNALVGAGGGFTQTSTGAIAVQQSAAMVRELARMQLAIARPRDIFAATEKIKRMCEREALAAVATYSYAKGGTKISGPSIRLAEVIAQCWGNITMEKAEIERGNGYSMMRVSALDLETNTESHMDFRVSHIIDTQKGPKILTDERSIYENNMNQGSRRLRSCILSLIPGDVVDAALEECEKTLTAKVGDEKQFHEKVRKLLKAFANLGINRKMVEKRIQRLISAMEPAQYVRLVEIGNSIRDGMSSVEDWFETSLADASGDDDGDDTPPQNKQEPKKDSVSALNEKLGVSGLKKGSEIAPPAQKKDAQTAPANGNAAAPANAEAKKDAPPANNAANAKPAAAPATAAPATAQTTQKKEDPNSLF